MKDYKVLNLYACLGGNRYKWDEVAERANVNLKVTAVELDPELATLYQERFPNDTVIVADAHQYLLEYYNDHDFIWSSPPCPTHSRANYWASVSKNNRDKYYADLTLYQEVIFLKHWFKGKYTVENVNPYYDLLIPGQERGRHVYWTNFQLPHDLGRDLSGMICGKSEIDTLGDFHDYDFWRYKGDQRRDKIARNLVDYEAGKTILEIALNIYKADNANQISLEL